MRRTKIVSTIGPASESPEVAAALIEAGMDVARLNFSHGSGEDHRRRIATIREVSRQLHKIVAIMVDTRGPEVRTGPLGEGGICLAEGAGIALTTAHGSGDENRVSVTYPRLPQDLAPGRIILIDDGMAGWSPSTGRGRRSSP